MITASDPAVSLQCICLRPVRMLIVNVILYPTCYYGRPLSRLLRIGLNVSGSVREADRTCVVVAAARSCFSGC